MADGEWRKIEEGNGSVRTNWDVIVTSLRTGTCLGDSDSLALVELIFCRHNLSFGYLYHLYLAYYLLLL